VGVDAWKTVVITAAAFSVVAAAPESTSAQGTRMAEQPLDGLHGGPVTTVNHPRGWFSFEIPQGWSIGRQNDEGMLVNPGLAGSDTLDALVLVTWGELEADRARMDVASLFPTVKAAIIQDLAAQSIQVNDSGAGPRVVPLAHTSGLVQEWPGKAGGRDVIVWFGGLVQDAHYFAVTAVVLAGKEERFLPGVRRLLYSVNARPPQRNAAAEQALAGAGYSAIETRPGGSRGSFSTIFEFSANNRVKKTMMMSGLVGLSADVGGSSEEWGTYEVVGDELTVSFRDGTDTLRLVVEGSQIVALARGERTYRRR
jgi:hypothetical protein